MFINLEAPYTIDESILKSSHKRKKALVEFENGMRDCLTKLIKEPRRRLMYTPIGEVKSHNFKKEQRVVVSIECVPTKLGMILEKLTSFYRYIFNE